MLFTKKDLINLGIFLYDVLIYGDQDEVKEDVKKNVNFWIKQNKISLIQKIKNYFKQKKSV